MQKMADATRAFNIPSAFAEHDPSACCRSEHAHLWQEPKKVCFLFNHDQTHQIAHSLPIALAMAAIPSVKVTLAVTTDRLAEQVARHAGPRLTTMDLVRLDLRSISSRFLAHTLNGLVPARKLLIYRDNLNLFRSFDAIVVAEKTSLMLKTRYKIRRPKIVHTRHGAGDRAIGFGRESNQFDLSLVSGPKIARRLHAESGVPLERIAVTGYPKFDICGDNCPALPFPDPKKPTVLYNPHPSPRLSSWFKMGPQVLDALTASGRYNVIFAPHVMLFARRHVVTITPPAVRRVRPLDTYLTERPNLLVDYGSEACTDMSYTNAADIYLGDVSSQVYEFLRRPRPCLHLNAHSVDWRNSPNYAHWHAGPVVEPDADIVAAVDDAVARHGEYLSSQRAMLADTFSQTEQPAAQRSACAIMDLLVG